MASPALDAPFRTYDEMRWIRDCPRFYLLLLDMLFPVYELPGMNLMNEDA